MSKQSIINGLLPDNNSKMITPAILRQAFGVLDIDNVGAGSQGPIGPRGYTGPMGPKGNDGKDGHKMVVLTRVAYDAIANKDPVTLYFIQAK